MGEKANWAYKAIEALDAEYDTDDIEDDHELQYEVRADHIFSQLTDEEYEEYLEMVLSEEHDDEDEEYWKQ